MTFRAAWYDAPLRTAVHPKGTRVAPPTIKNGCWGCCVDVVAGGEVCARSCAMRARKDRLTCVSHRPREKDAQELKRATSELVLGEATSELVREIPAAQQRMEITAATSAQRVRRREVVR